VFSSKAATRLAHRRHRFFWYLPPLHLVHLHSNHDPMYNESYSISTSKEFSDAIATSAFASILCTHLHIEPSATTFRDQDDDESFEAQSREKHFTAKHEEVESGYSSIPPYAVETRRFWRSGLAGEEGADCACAGDYQRMVQPR
jgi:hypothetical protein